MRLVSANFRRYRSIEGGRQIPLEPTVACVVGKNEFGNAAVLPALYKTNRVATWREISAIVGD